VCIAVVVYIAVMFSCCLFCSSLFLYIFIVYLSFIFFAFVLLYGVMKNDYNVRNYNDYVKLYFHRACARIVAGVSAS